MEDTPIGALIGVFFFLLMLSAFFSGSETALMSLNRYRLKHLSQSGNPGAMRAHRLLQQPDRLIGLILIGNNFVNILVTQLATYIGYRLFGDAGIAIATGVLTLLLLIFAEVAPKTLGAIHSESFAFPAARIYTPLLKIVYPLVWTINFFANNFLKLLGVPETNAESQALDSEELRSVVNEAGSLIPSTHQQMLLRVLDLEEITVEDIMVRRTEIYAIDLTSRLEAIEEQLHEAPYTRLPVYRGNINNIIGYVHMRRLTSMLANDTLTLEGIEKNMRSPYFIPESTTLTQQLLNFKHERRRHAIVVDEYGDIQGIVTLEDILEEIVGEFTAEPGGHADIHPQQDGSAIVDGGLAIRELNRALNIDLPTKGPRTLNGLILEILETIPENNTSLLVSGYPLEIIKVTDNTIKTVRIKPRLPHYDDPEHGQ